MAKRTGVGQGVWWQKWLFPTLNIRYSNPEIQFQKGQLVISLVIAGSMSALPVWPCLTLQRGQRIDEEPGGKSDYFQPPIHYIQTQEPKIREDSQLFLPQQSNQYPCHQKKYHWRFLPKMVLGPCLKLATLQDGPCATPISHPFTVGQVFSETPAQQMASKSCQGGLPIQYSLPNQPLIREGIWIERNR